MTWHRKMRSAARRLRWRLIEALEPRRRVAVRGLGLTLQCDNRLTQFRLETLETKEPETLDWIDAHLGAAGDLFDIGGNIGVITVYAALRHPRLRVTVFEPEYSNLHLLRDNLVANGLSARVQVYPLAVGDRIGPSQFYVSDLTPGAALHSESPSHLQTTASSQPVVLTEGTWVVTLDEFCRQSGVWPDALKIDVDGNEDRVLAGAAQVLAYAGLRSILVEAGDAGLQQHTSGLLHGAGFSRRASVQRSEAGNELWQR